MLTNNNSTLNLTTPLSSFKSSILTISVILSISLLTAQAKTYENFGAFSTYNSQE